MYYVYSREIESGREDFIKVFDTMKEAVEWVRFCYNTDYNSAMRNMYYYFIKKH